MTGLAESIERATRKLAEIDRIREQNSEQAKQYQEAYRQDREKRIGSALELAEITGMRNKERKKALKQEERVWKGYGEMGGRKMIPNPKGGTGRSYSKILEDKLKQRKKAGQAGQSGNVSEADILLEKTLKDTKNAKLDDGLWDFLDFTEKQERKTGYPIYEPEEMRKRYNTTIEPARVQEYRNWLAEMNKIKGRNIEMDTYDYDVQGQFLDRGAEDLNQATRMSHGMDTYKKPSHPTFSDESKYHGVDGVEGGKWAVNPDGSEASFTPGETNLRYRPFEELQDYFDKYEKGIKLIDPREK